MADQTPCPHCGGFKVGQDSVQVDRQTNAVETYLISDLWNSGWIVFVFPLYLLLLPIDIWLWITWRKKKKITMYKYECRLCGYKWTWRIDQPPPIAFGVRPDLIAKGEQKLKEAEDAQRALEAHEWMRRYGNK